MPANFTSGFFVREPAWHGLGNVLAESPKNWADARTAADLNWEPIKAPVFGWQGKRADGTLTFDPAETEDVDGKPRRIKGEYVLIEDKSRVVHSDSGLNLAVPGIGYEVIDHTEIGAIMEALNDQPNVAYETTVVLDDGRAIAVVVRLDEPVVLPGDNTQTLPYLTLHARHDGTGKVRAQSTSIRVVCMNTFAAAEMQADRNGTVYEFSHTKNWRDHLEAAKIAIAGLGQDFREYTAFASHLATVPVTPEQVTTYIEAFMPMPIASIEASPTVIRHIEEARGTFRAILGSATCETIADNAFGLLQASGEYCDWYRGYRNQSTLFKRQMLRPEKLKVEAVRLISEVIPGVKV